MTRTRANSGQATKRSVAATPDASLPLDLSVCSIVADLEGHHLNGAPIWAANRPSEEAHLAREQIDVQLDGPNR
jgi:hypothetical protein